MHLFRENFSCTNSTKESDRFAGSGSGQKYRILVGLLEQWSRFPQVGSTHGMCPTLNLSHETQMLTWNLPENSRIPATKRRDHFENLMY